MSVPQLADAESLQRFVVDQLTKFTGKSILPADLATALIEIEHQTQIYGAAFLKVHLADPEWRIITSGLLQVEQDGLLNEVEVEFPEGSGSWWRLAAVEGSTEIGMPNLIMTLEARVVARMREQWGHKPIPPGFTTRAQFLRALVHEANLKEHLNPPIRFVCPGVSRVEPVAESGKEQQEKLQTPATQAAAGAKANKEPGPITRTSWAESLLKAGGWPVTEQNILAFVGWAIAEGGAGPQFGVAGNTANYNPLNTTQEAKGATNTGVQGNIKSYVSWAQGIEATVTTLRNGKYPGILAALTAGTSKAAVASAVGQSPWGTSAAGVEAGVAAAKVEKGGVSVLVTGSEGAKAGSDIGQLSRGTPQNPDEDSWDCGTRLAQEVNWDWFTDAKDTIYLMDGPDLVHQAPVLYIDVPANAIQRVQHGQKQPREVGALIRPMTFTVDNVSYQYRATHKVKGKLARKAKISKPATPAEIRIRILCDIDEFRAGEVFAFVNSGPISENGGRWIVADATRRCFKDPYTQFILVPPTEPLPEPQASAGTTSSSEAGSPGSALAAFSASDQLSRMDLPYLWGGGHGPGGLVGVKKGGSGLDCSGSTCWVLHEANMFPATQAIVSGELEKWGEPGQGKEMTVWASSNHVFIEFNIPGHERAQMNTNGPQNGPRLYTMSQNPTYNPNPSQEGYVARHWAGT